jgi:hypothetical protein
MAASQVWGDGHVDGAVEEFGRPVLVRQEVPSKMSVGSQSVAQAFGMSTTPEMWPCTGAVPRIA